MKTTAAIQDCKPNQLSENVSAFSTARDSNAENMDPLKSFSPELSSGNGSSTNFQNSLISALGNLDLNDIKIHRRQVRLDSVPDKAKSCEELLSSDCLPDEEKSNEDSVINSNCGSSTENADAKSKCSMRDHVTNSSFIESENVESIRSIDVVNINMSTLSSRNASCVKNEDSAAYFSEIGLSEKPSCNVLTSGSEVNSNKLDKEKPNEGSEVSSNKLDKEKPNEGSVINANHRSSAGDANIKSKCSITVHIKNNSCKDSEYVESLRSIDVVNMNMSVRSHAESPRNINYCVIEDGLVACFKEISLNEKPSGNELTSVSEISSSKPGRDKSSSENLPLGEACGTVSQCANDLPLKTEKDLHCEKEIPGHLGVTDSVAKGNIQLDDFVSKKSESLLEGEILNFGDLLSDEELIERGSRQSSDDQKRKETKLGRTLKATNEEWPNDYLKHWSGGRCTVSATPSMQAPLPLYFDQKVIHPIRQGIPDYHSDDDNSFTTSCSDDSFLTDALSFTTTPPPPCSDINSCMSLPAESTVLLGAQNQQNVHSQYTGTSYSVLEMCNSPASEILNCSGQSSWPTTLESGHGCQPVHPTSDCRPTSPESGYGSPSRFGFSDDDGVDCSTEEDKQNIRAIKEYLKNGETNVAVKRMVEDTFSMCPDQLGSQNIHQGFSCDVNTLHLQGCSIPTDVNQHQEPSACANVPAQQKSACVNVVPLQQKSACASFPLQQKSACANVPVQQQVACVNVPNQQISAGVNVPLPPQPATVSSPQVIVVWVPFAAEGVNKGHTKFRPILPNLPQGQQAHMKTSKKRLLETLDSTEIKYHLYSIYERLKNNEKNVIYIENNETRRTNLHNAVIRKQVALAYCILEVHKQFNKNMSAVNSRDIHKKTALHYAVTNVMTVFVDYLKEFGAK